MYAINYLHSHNILRIHSEIMLEEGDIFVHLKEGVTTKNKLILKYNKWSPDIHIVVHFSIFNFKFWTRITQLRSRNTQSWARSTLIMVLD